MSTNTNARPDSVLKRLPEELQIEIIERLKEPAFTLAKCRAWLREDGISTSLSALSRFRDWWLLRQQLTKNEATVEQLIERLPKAGLTPEQIQEVGQSFFTALALEQQDVKSWHLAQSLALKKQQLGLDSRKLALLEKKAAQADAARNTTADDSLTPEQKDAKLRQIFGMT